MIGWNLSVPWKPPAKASGSDATGGKERDGVPVGDGESTPTLTHPFASVIATT